MLVACEECGGRLRLSREDRKYVCTRQETHRFGLEEAEQRWLKVAFGPEATRLVHEQLVQMAIEAEDFVHARVHADAVSRLTKAELGRAREAHLAALEMQARLADEARDTKLRMESLHAMVPLLEQLGAERPEDASGQLLAARCFGELGALARSLGSEEDAHSYYERELGWLLKVHGAMGQDGALELAETHFNLYLTCNGIDEEQMHLQESLRLVESCGEAGGKRAQAIRERVSQQLACMGENRCEVPEGSSASTVLASALQEQPSLQDRSAPPACDCVGSSEPQDALWTRAWLAGEVSCELERRRQVKDV